MLGTARGLLHIIRQPIGCGGQGNTELIVIPRFEPDDEEHRGAIYRNREVRKRLPFQGEKMSSIWNMLCVCSPGGHG